MAALQVFLLFIVSNVVASQEIIRTLPGFDGDLPFKLETGYVGVGEMDDVQLFYYFIESERSPQDDPLVLWLTGGPGSSAFSGLVYEIGPLIFDYENSKQNLPKFLLNPYSWTKVANIIFLDAPVGTGFSYANSWQGYTMNDTLAALQNYYFLRKWLIAHPNFLANPLYVSGDSYSGKIVPMVVKEISDGIDVGHEPTMNLKSAKRNCKGDYVNVDPSNGLCIADLQNITACTGKINSANIYEPDCSLDILTNPLQFKWDRSLIEEDFLFLPTQPAARPWCRKYNYAYSYSWANDKTVQRALGIREGSVEYWVRFNKSLSYTQDLPSSLDYHLSLIKKGCQVLIYSGDVDMSIPYIATEAWIKSLNLTIETGWQPWFVEGQVAG